MIENQVMFSSKSDDYPTPNWLFRSLDAAEGPFDFDVAATPQNTKCVSFVSRDSLYVEWHEHGKRIWCNPPYQGSRLGAWVQKGCAEARQGCKVCMLLPSYTDKPWWHEIVLPCAAKIYFVLGRVMFRNAPQQAPFPNVAVIFDSKIRKTGPKLLSLGNWARHSSNGDWR